MRTPCVDDYHLKRQDFEVVGDLALVCAQTVLKCVCCARICWADILSRAVTKWNRGCHQRLARLTRYFHSTKDDRQVCHVGGSVDQDFFFLKKKKLARF